jgi:hypothetical protein
MTNPTIEEVVQHVNGLSEEQTTHLTRSLQEREDTMRDQLHMAGMQFGLYPQIIAEVLAEVGFGTPPTEMERAMIRQAFLTLMNELSQGQQPGGPGAV